MINSSQLIADMEDDELFALRVQVDKELAKRGISFNVGILGEKLVSSQ